MGGSRQACQPWREFQCSPEVKLPPPPVPDGARPALEPPACPLSGGSPAGVPYPWPPAHCAARRDRSAPAPGCEHGRFANGKNSGQKHAGAIARRSRAPWNGLCVLPRDGRIPGPPGLFLPGGGPQRSARRSGPRGSGRSPQNHLAVINFHHAATNSLYHLAHINGWTWK